METRVNLMYGWIHDSIKQLVIRKYDMEVWQKVVAAAGFEEGFEAKMDHYYKDEETKSLVSAVSSTLGMSVEEVWEAYGGFLLSFTMEKGWDELLRALAGDLKGFLENLDALHYFVDHFVFPNAGMRGPSFRVEEPDEDTLVLHYYSRRSGLYPIVKGVVREVSRQIFQLEISMKVVERKMEMIQDPNHVEGSRMEEHVSFRIQELSQLGVCHPGTLSCYTGTYLSEELQKKGITMKLGLQDFIHVFPYHIVFDRELLIQHCGVQVKRSFPFLAPKATKITDIFHIVHPEVPMTFDSFMHFRSGIFVFQLKISGYDCEGATRVFVKGQMIVLHDTKHLLYMCSPLIATVRELLDRGLHIADLPLFDVSRDLILLNQQRVSQLELNKALEETTESLQIMARDLRKEQEKTENLLKELLPESVADALRQGKTVEAGEYAEATILFSDIVTFTVICSQCPPIQVVTLLNELYLRFDRLTGLNHVYKVETIGDAYMVVGGVPEQCENHAELVANMAIGMIWEAKSVISPVSFNPLQIRVGMHTGPVVAGVVGQKMPRYCLFGDTVNTASRMESHGVPGRIHMSSDTHRAADNLGMFEFEYRGEIDVKGKGKLKTYFLLRNKRKSVWEITHRRRGDSNSIDGYKELHIRESSTDDKDDAQKKPRAEETEYRKASGSRKLPIAKGSLRSRHSAPAANGAPNRAMHHFWMRKKNSDTVSETCCIA